MNKRRNAGAARGQKQERPGQGMFALLDAARFIHARLESALGEVGLSTAKYEALEQLVLADEPLALSELAERLRCVRSNVTQLVDRLEADGLVRRAADPEDRRAIRAMITPLGRERQAAGAEAIRALHAELRARVAPADRKHFQRVLGVLSTLRR